ncbi:MULTISPECIES: DUF4231 domain-containing protein [Leptolyngbya]|jgi:hypothetical protein|uniref:DUF4231 domain-containing protein n=2 Tax=Leptolyngbya boryana TaxID=1184 RepID=A0A1Z4JMQ3_LEPBY|nr:MULTISPECIES: DUF4231 domain-containing protein [Leptolyngbya]BAY58045.1 hypothetical protein NIES2135_49180 [Leptolyngbya boryana NIES-2135]MBD2367488.1 DUF4231 domain-containing protein [Leptolyngbya sp. FACHB-161]MBD2374012.1 DUF4231 domain-containing protein [Leptolyngbya sp. FACHB-238]MBD2398188.1 DUF4231 domain-containing protein [Leptolyngbya sp. FACHB-239]MBD2404315.1 DUF4231 domain-containing protein [Leptolyngbya sp. FACHB-402]
MNKPKVDYNNKLQSDFEGMIERLDLEQSGKDYLKLRWLEQVLWMEGKSNKMRDRHQSGRKWTIVLSAILPIIVLLNFNEDKIFERGIKVATVAISSAIAIGTALEEFHQYGKRWYSYRRASELLKTQGWQFFQLSGAYRTYENHRQALPIFSEQVESIIQRDVEVYVTEGMQQIVQSEETTSPAQLPSE